MCPWPGGTHDIRRPQLEVCNNSSLRFQIICFRTHTRNASSGLLAPPPRIRSSSSLPGFFSRPRPLARTCPPPCGPAPLPLGPAPDQVLQYSLRPRPWPFFLPPFHLIVGLSAPHSRWRPAGGGVSNLDFSDGRPPGGGRVVGEGRTGRADAVRSAAALLLVLARLGGRGYRIRADVGNVRSPPAPRRVAGRRRRS